MIYSISGKVVVTEPGYVVLETGGIGYKISVSGNTLGCVARKKNDGDVRLLTHMAIRDDAVELYGFFSQEELTSFKMLLSVSGVGPKGALALLSHLSPEKFALAVVTADSKMLSGAQGIGKRTAERIILELKDKISKDSCVGISETSDENVDMHGNADIRTDAVNTLIVLGYTRGEAVAALRGIDFSDVTLEQAIKDALKKLMKQ